MDFSQFQQALTEDMVYNPVLGMIGFYMWHLPPSDWSSIPGEKQYMSYQAAEEAINRFNGLDEMLTEVNIEDIAEALNPYHFVYQLHKSRSGELLMNIDT